MAKKEGRWETWEGGRVWIDSAGKRNFHIRKRIGGKLYQISTRTTTLRAAMAELARFEADPGAYKAGGPPRKEPVYLTPETSAEFLKWSFEVKGNGRRHVNYQSKFLAWWEPHLRGKDLRGIDIRLIEAPLEDTPSRANKIITLKTFFSWLVEVKRDLEPNEDPTFRRLKVPQAKPAQHRKKKAITAGEFAIIRAKLEAFSKEKSKAGRLRFNPKWIDAIDFLAGTGWHVTELERFSRAGHIEEHDDPEAPGILEVIHKSGDVHRALVSAHVLEAAKRIRKDEVPFVGDSLRTALQRACKAIGIPTLHPGSFRHSIATHAINAGASIEATSEYLGHRLEENRPRSFPDFCFPIGTPFRGHHAAVGCPRKSWCGGPVETRWL